MADIDVSINGKPWKIAVQPAAQAGRYTVTVKGKSREIDVAWINPDTLSIIDAGGAAYEIGLTRRARGIDVAIGGRTFHAVTQKRGREPFSDQQKKEVIAPMPGRVVRVLVAPGDKVSARQGVVVIEAMKMENELRAPKDGTVSQVLVQAGTAVETGAVVVVIE